MPRFYLPGTGKHNLAEVAMRASGDSPSDAWLRDEDAAPWPCTRLAEAIACGRDVVACGGDLAPGRLMAAYRHGIFPWYEPGEPILWWCPDPRAILELDRLHVSRRLRRTVRSGRFRVTVDAAFASVIRGCALGRPEGTWLSEEMIAAYTLLHELGHAHSVECWHGDRLAGGVYGVAAGGLFAAESMFHRERDASKVALVALVGRLRAGGFTLLDIQCISDHTARLGAEEIPRVEYLRRLRHAVGEEAAFV